MFLKYFITGIQIVSGLVLSVFVGLTFKHNNLGYNLINICACIILFLRIDNIIAFYRFYIKEPFLENFATFFIGIVILVCSLLEKHHTTRLGKYHIINQFCYIFLTVIFTLNLLYYVIAILTLYFHIVKQLFKLANGTILSSSTTLLQQQLNLLRNSFKPFQQISQRNVLINQQCSICICNFQDDQICIVLPGCGHCFHSECIDDWLSSKSNCPNCRCNIRLGLLQNDY